MKVVEKSGMKLIGISVRCETMEEYQQEIPKTEQLLHRRIEEIPNRINDSYFYGVFKVDGEADEDAYWVCVEVDEHITVPVGMKSITVPASKYAMLEYEGPNHGIHSAYFELHKQLQSEGFTRQKSDWTIEQYEENRPQTAEHIQVLLHEPVQ